MEELDKAIRFKDAQREEIINEMAAVRAVSYDKDRVRSSMDGDQMTNLMIRLDELAGDINKMRAKYFTKKNEIINQIILLREPRYADLLYKRYVEYKSFEMIAVETNYSYDRTVHMHKESLEMFEREYHNSIQ